MADRAVMADADRAVNAPLYTRDYMYRGLKIIIIIINCLSIVWDNNHGKGFLKGQFSNFRLKKNYMRLHDSIVNIPVLINV